MSPLRMVAGLLLLAAWLLVGAIPATGTPAAAGQGADPPAGVVLVGAASLAWADVTAKDMPTLYGLVGQHAVASMTVRSVRSRTCMNDGWLTIGAGRRAADTTTVGCARSPFIQPVPGEPWVVSGWAGLVDHQKQYSYDARPGTLGDALTAGGACTTAVGPGAAVALADSDGRVSRYSPDVPPAAELTACPVTVVDLGWLPPQTEPEERRSAARGIDARLADVMDRLPAEYPLLVAGIADSGPVSPRLDGEPTELPPPGLRVGLAAGRVTDGGTTYGPHWLTTPSTRWTGLVQLTDITPTLLAYAGVPIPPDLAGKTWQRGDPHPATTMQTLTELDGAERAAQVFRTQSGWFFQLLGLVEVIVFGAALLAMRRRPRQAPRILPRVQVFALAAASFPVASFLANLSRWWLTTTPALVLWPTILLLTTLIALIAALGPCRRRVYGPPGVVAAITALAMSVDVLTGSHLQHSSLLGLSPLVAGRFYGFGNIPYAIFVAASLVTAASLAQWALDSGRSRRYATAVAATVGAVAVMIDGHPGAGADVGGIIATIPAFAVLLFAVGRWRVSISRVFLVFFIAFSLFAALAMLDWLRPPAERTHFGAFVESLLSGEAWTVIGRKAGASISTLSRSVYGWLVPVAIVLIATVMRNPARWRAGHLRITLRHWPLLEPLIWAGLTAGVVGFAANDSGVIVPALILTIGIPLVASAVAHATRIELSGSASAPVAGARPHG